MHTVPSRPRPLAALLAGLLALSPVLAVAAPHKKPPPPAPPKELGTYGAWVAATHGTGAARICYAFTRTDGQDPISGSGPVLSVTDRAGGRNQVAISAGPLYPKNAGVMVSVGTTKLDFYTSAHDAFARDGKATVEAFERGATAVLHPPGKTHPLSFSLKGFSAAHAAIRKACPPK
ncbi:MAG: hypothetical protein KGI51_07375 [Rhodospirillales bacterium]|nr:hypothetical protein [Rhodospirillales bacterium]